MNVGALVSGRGRGTNLQAIMDACAAGRVPARVAVVISTNPDAPALLRAASAGVTTRVVDPEACPEGLDAALAGTLEAYDVELVCLTPFMRLLGSEFLRRFPNRVINVHPSLLPAFGGKGYYGQRVHVAVLESGARFSGATVHFVDGEYDHGPIILQESVPVLPDDTPESLAARVLVVEHRLYPEAVGLFAEGRLELQGRTVRILPRRGESSAADPCPPPGLSADPAATDLPS